MTWPKAVEYTRPFVVKISTPRGTGTGFLLYRLEGSDLYGIATAAHVIDHAHYWEQPIRFHHPNSQTSVLVRHEERAIFLDEQRDTAVILHSIGSKDFPLPAKPPILAPEKKCLKVGNEVGWLGFPAVSSSNLCFFSGRTSCFISKDHAYLIDGVAINGVSGGPTFHLNQPTQDVLIIGVVSAYIANRATGETLPGLSVVQDVSHFQELLAKFQSIAEAKKNEAPPQKPPPNPEGKDATP
ncbi:MAG: serine protease [Elusimicrobia bacterium]|nr:serine protease [Elusimicrobiota bacterium]